jgi:hypothetical protein
MVQLSGELWAIGAVVVVLHRIKAFIIGGYEYLLYSRE